MKTNNKDVLYRNTIFVWIALATVTILSIPFLAMRFDWRLPDPGYSVSDKVVWTLSDFVLVGALFFGTSSLYVLVARRMQKHRLVIGILFAIAVLWLWAELAVGVFTNWGS